MMLPALTVLAVNCSARSFSGVRSRAPLHCGARAANCDGSSWGAQALGTGGFVAVTQDSVWHLPGPAREPVSPALTDRFLSTAPPENSRRVFYVLKFGVTFLENCSSYPYFQIGCYRC